MEINLTTIVILVLLLVVVFEALLLFALARSAGGQFPAETANLLTQAQRGLGMATAMLVWVTSRTPGTLDDSGAAILAAVMKGFGIDIPDLPLPANSASAPAAPATTPPTPAPTPPETPTSPNV